MYIECDMACVYVCYLFACAYIFICVLEYPVIEQGV